MSFRPAKTLSLIYTGLLIFMVAWGLPSGLAEEYEEGPLSAETGRSYHFDLVTNELEQAVTLRLILDELRVDTVAIDGESFTMVEVPGAGLTYDLGEPQLPLIARMFRISDTLKPVVEVVPVRTRTRTVTAPVLPSQQMDPMDIQQIEFRNTAVYAQSSRYPVETVRLHTPEIFRDLRVLQVGFCPVTYEPATGLLTIVEEAEIRITYDGPDTENVITGYKPPITATFGDLYRAFIPNYNDTETNRGIQEHYMVVIQEADLSYITSWQAWKEEEGFIVDVLSITPSTTDYQLHNAILSAYESANRPVFVVLCGRENEIPIHTSTYSYTWNGSPWNGNYTDDSYYSRLEGTDYIADVLIGRLPGHLSMTTMLARALYWEKTPYMADNYYTRAQMSCSTLYASQQVTKEQTGERLERVHNFGTVHENYIWNSSTLGTIMDHIDDGVSIINYRGEGWTSGWNPGHQYSFSYYDVEDLNNLYKPLVLTSIGCGVCMFDSGTCFGEAWMRLGDTENIKGAVTVLGPTGNTHTTFNNWLDRGIYRGLAYDDLYYVSQAYIAGKLYMREHLSSYDAICEMESGKFLQLGTPDTRFRTILPNPPAWGFAYSPTSSDKYIAARSAENWRAVSARLVLDPGGLNEDYLMLGTMGEALLGLPAGTSSIPVRMSGYNMKPFTETLDMTGETGRLLITEVKPDIVTDGTAGDIVEIYNADTMAIDLKNMILSDLDLYDIPFVRSSVILEPGEIAVVHLVGAVGTEQVLTRSYGYEIFSRAYADFSSQQDQCVIRNYKGEIIDGLAWHNGDGLPATRNDYRDLSRFTSPTSGVTVSDEGWWNAPDDVSETEYDTYSIDWSLYAGAGGEGSIQRIGMGNPDGVENFEVRADTSWGEFNLSQPTATPTPDLPTATPTATPTPEQPTATPTPNGPTATPTPNENCSALGVTLWMPATHFQPGHPCGCRVTVCNPSQQTYQNVPLFVILDVLGSYFFAPSFTEFDYYSVSLPHGEMVKVVLPDFDWPQGAGTLTGVRWLAAMTDPNISQLFGGMDTWEFGWSE